jgi:hypothetical protein
MNMNYVLFESNLLPPPSFPPSSTIDEMATGYQGRRPPLELHG